MNVKVANYPYELINVRKKKITLKFVRIVCCDNVIFEIHITIKYRVTTYDYVHKFIKCTFSLSWTRRSNTNKKIKK
jgi:hypothetical protein